MNSHKNTVIVIAGPTAVGKTAVAIKLAQHFHTAIISADSRQCYREMNIGTAKPSADELQTVRHYFVDSFSIHDVITAADFEKFALQYLEQIFEKKNIAIVCGGTGLYINALCEGLNEMPAVDESVEAVVNTNYKKNGIEWLQQMVKNEDPFFYGYGEIQNPARMLRALVFKRSTGKSIIEFQSGKKKKRDFNIIRIALELPREKLYQRINRRVDAMMQAGLYDEVKALFPYKSLKNLQTVGYAELFNFLEGKCNLQEAIGKIKQHTRNYAKRQITWFKKDKEYHWLNADDEDLKNKILKVIYPEAC